jgi:hypothetical protein
MHVDLWLDCSPFLDVTTNNCHGTHATSEIANGLCSGPQSASATFSSAGKGSRNPTTMGRIIIQSDWKNVNGFDTTSTSTLLYSSLPPRIAPPSARSTT